MVDSHVFIISQILKLISGDVKAHDCIIRRVQQNILIICNDKEIDERCKILFKKAGVNGVTYYKRIEEILLAEEKYPIIPFLVIDHISKPFDASNAKAIGQVIEKACT